MGQVVPVGHSSAEDLIAAMPAARGVDTDGAAGPACAGAPDAAVTPAIAQLDEITGSVGTPLR